MPSLAAEDASLVAPSLGIGSHDIVTVEHPGVVRSIDRALASLGGHDRLEEFLTSKDPEKELGCRLRPEDRFRRPIFARQIDRSDLVLRFTVPKLTGRKRKRGSKEPYQSTADEPIPTELRGEPDRLLQILKDNADVCDVQVVGQAANAYRFTGLPDFQWSLAASGIAKRLDASVPSVENPFAPGSFPLLTNVFPDIRDRSRLRDLTLDTKKKGNHPNIEIMPPPRILLEEFPHDYQFATPDFSTTSTDVWGNPKIMNKSLIPKSHMYMLDRKVSKIPFKPKSSLPPESALDEYNKHLLEELKTLFERTPIWTRRSLLNSLPKGTRWELRYTLQYAAYMFKSGPWKDSYIKLGVDPRTDPACRQYQTISSRIQKYETASASRNKARESEVQHDRKSHIFDGQRASIGGATWAICDITDPYLRKIIDKAQPREKCDYSGDGWFQSCTMAKIRTIVRDKLKCIAEGIEPDNSTYARIVDLPETLDQEHMAKTYVPEGTTLPPREADVLTQLRTWVKSEVWRNKKELVKDHDSELHEAADSDDENVDNEGDEVESADEGEQSGSTENQADEMDV